MANERIPPVDEVQLLRAASCDWRLSRGDIGVFAVILQHCDQDRIAYPGPTRIGRLASLAPTNVKASIRRLEALKYIQVTRPGARKKNRFTVLASPSIPSRKTLRIIAKCRRELGTPTGPVSAEPPAPAGYTGVPSTGYAGVQQLGMPTRQEVALKALQKAQELLAKPQEEQRPPAKVVQVPDWPRAERRQVAAGGGAKV